MDCRVGGIIFSSNFDSGNLARVEKVSYDTDERSSSVTTSNKSHSQKGNANTNNSIFGNTSIADVRVDHEFKIWTKPDCAGTIYENGNRTWFYFSVRGCSPGKVVKFTVMNMNKQSKIYSQGYAPLYRVHNSSVSQSRWQRIRDRPLWEIVNGQFLLTFVHRFLDPRGSITYFAFCYPWTYNEMQLQLSKLDVIFHYNKVDTDKENLTLHKCNEGNEVKNDKFDGIGNSVVVPELVTASTVNTTVAITGEITDVTTLSATSSSSSSSSTSSEEEKFCRSEKELFDKIYFHRELLCYSLEGRRIELLTITDWSGCTYVEEDRFDPLLFPEINKKRCWKFTNKKVVLVSARVHPGETPSSHVFNGILEFLLRLNDQRACELRKNFIFKLIPMLNPDGVFHGHYRTDTLGINLNRVYLKPDFLYYPSIYATKALITYYHTNYGTIKPYAAFLDDIFKRKVHTDTSGILVAPPSPFSPSSSSPSSSSNSKTTENDPNSVGAESSDLSNSVQVTVEKSSNDKLFKNVAQNPVLTFGNNSEDGSNTTREEEGMEKSVSKFGVNDSVKPCTTLDEPNKNGQSSFPQQTVKSLFSTATPLSQSPPITKGTTLNQKENHSSSTSSSTSSSSIGQLLLNSDLPLINEGVSVIHKINYSVNGADAAANDDDDDGDSNDVTDTATGQNNDDTENMPNCQHIKTKTNNSSLKRLLRINNSKLTSTPSYLAELNKDLSKTFTNYLKPVKFPLVCNTEVASQRNTPATTMTTTTTQPSSSFTSTTRTTTSATNNLTPSVKRLITSAPNNILIKRTIGDSKKSKKSYKDYKSNGFKGSGRNQPNRILSFFNRGKRYPALKVDCLPCFFMKWNAPYRQAITNGQISNASLQKKEPPTDVLLSSNTMPILNRDNKINYNSTKSLVHQKSQLVPEQIKEKSLICLNNDNTKTLNDDIQMISYGDVINASFSLVPQEYIHRNNKNDNDYMNVHRNTLLNPETHLLCSNEEEILNETALHTITDDSCCLSTVGNEGSDMDDEENVHLLNNFNEKSNVEDFSINPQFLHILESIETLVKNEKNLNKTQLSNDDTSTSESGNDLNMNESDRIELLKQQLHQLRKADHLCDESLIQNEESNVAFYFDLHGHCSKRGCFLYGNWLDTEENMVDNVLYALLVGVNSIYFDFDSCNFTLRNMYQKDRKGNFTKEGAGRVALWKHLGLTHCYTVECNYNAGPLPSRLSRFIASNLPNDSGRFTPTGAFYGPHWSNLVDTGSMQSWNCGISTQTNSMHNIYSNHTYQTSSGAPRYTPAHYEDVGRALMIAILDMNQINPWPKIASLGGSNAEPGVGILNLPTSLLEFSNITNLKEWARKYIKAMAPSNMPLKVYTNRFTEDSTSKLSDTNKPQISIKTIPPSESSEGVKNPLSLTNKSTQNSLSTMQSHENSSSKSLITSVIQSNTSKKVSISKTNTSQTTSDIYSTVTLLDKSCTARRNTSPKLNRKHHLYRLNPPVASHFNARNKQQQQHRKFSTAKDTSDVVLEVLSASCSRPSSATTEETKTWPATVFNNHSEEHCLKTLKNEDNYMEFDRYNSNTKACYFYDYSGEKSSKVIHKDFTEQSFKNKIKEGEIKNKKCVHKKKSSLHYTKKRPTYLSTNNQIPSDEMCDDNKLLKKTQSFNINCSSSILEYTNSSYGIEGTVNSTTPYVSNEQSSNLFTNIPLKICDSSEDSVTTKHIYMNPVDNKETQGSDKMKPEGNEHKSAKAQYNDKMKYAYIRKVGRIDACNGFSYTKPGYTKLFKHYTNIHRSDNRNTSIKAPSANHNSNCSNNNNNNHKTPKLNNNRTCGFTTYNTIRHRKSRLNKLKSSTKRPCLENITLNDDRNSNNNDICTMQKLTISDHNNFCEYNSNISSSRSTTGNRDILNNIDNVLRNYTDTNTTNIMHTTEENTLAPPLIIRSQSLRDLLNTSESEDCIKELKELFKSVSLN
ncbi:unnamed protein product [Trichobilharzia szidati]|nr:unnamed protein product [Trichobilharzia szidati]